MDVELAETWPALREPSARAPQRPVGITVINFNTHIQTLRCLASLSESTEAPKWILVLDNCSAAEDYQALLEGIVAMQRSEIRLYRSATNLGFAAGSNFLIVRLLEESCSYVGLLNNDAVAKPNMVTLLVDALAEDPARIGLSGGRMHKLHNPDEVDTLGICIYASLMPADRHSTTDPYLGPTGGCCMIARELLEELLRISGYCFDERYFCYCEDTDLVLRANLLGYEPAYVDELIALHEGQASSGGGFNRFIAYHGIRNSIWMQMKLMPNGVLLKHGILLLTAHVLSITRHVLGGHGKLMWKAYRDAWARRKEFFKERRQIQAVGMLKTKLVSLRFAPRFYRAGYARYALVELCQRYGFIN